MSSNLEYLPLIKFKSPRSIIRNSLLSSIPHLLKMQLITVVALASAVLAAPTAESACTKAAKGLKFEITDFTFNSKAIYSTPAHLATSEGTVDFDFGVSAKKNPIHCSAESVSTYPNYFDGKVYKELSYLAGNTEADYPLELV